MPYHVRITPKSDPSHDEVKLDLTKKELEERFLTPYHTGHPIVIAGKTIPIDDIDRITVTYTDENSEQLLPIVRAERVSSSVISDISDEWEVAYRGKDLTDEFITGPPGTQAVLRDSAVKGEAPGKTNRVKAHRLAEKVLKESSQDGISVSSLLEKCHTIVMLLNRESEFEWITLELNGYHEKYPKNEDLEANLPRYRWVIPILRDQAGRPANAQAAPDLIKPYPLVGPMASLESSTIIDTRIQPDKTEQTLAHTIPFLRYQPYIPGSKVAESIEVVKAKIRDFADNIISEPLDTRRDRSNERLDAYNLYRALNLHPRIRQVSEGLFKDGHYPQAILEAYKEVNNIVKVKSCREDLDGKTLMDQVFKFEHRNGHITEKPLIQINELQSQSDRDEQLGFQFLFGGAILAIRNPKAHDTNFEKNPHAALEYIAFASLLAERVEKAKKNS